MTVILMLLHLGFAAIQTNNKTGQAVAWFNLGLTLENVDRQSDAIGAYRNGCELYQVMGLDAMVQDCNNAIERLSQPQVPVMTSSREFWCWVRSWFRL